ncbi:hypothetical protein [Daejeonella sp. H1SJ63]|uniref:hypothetical protein n=1 Tax=Daejeonella sp. H1SJ63 TaxID=3034145 RepID=UPI0023EB5358|nr:hypothetical protein [Daejeonella sp. H1SJ63]
MKRSYLISFILTILFNAHAYSQQADSLKQAHIKYISKSLAVPEGIAQQVAFILDQYKEKAKASINDKSLTGDSLRVKLDQLIDDKNSKLKKILTEQQLQKIVPTTERRKNEPSSGT